VLRTALRPRWLALLLLVLVAASGMAWLGQWQLNRAREHGRQPVERAELAQQRATPKPLEQVLTARQTFPKDAVNTRVTATGHWDFARRLLITDRSLNGRTGYWVLVPLRLADGSALPVVRGWVASPSDPAAAGAAPRGGTGAGTVEVVGLLQPSEPPLQRAPGQGSGLAADQLDRIAVTDLVNRWPYPLITGFVVQQSQSPATGPAPAPVPPPVVQSGLNLQNLVDALQWWLFAAIGFFFWWRLVRDDYLGHPNGPDKPEALTGTAPDDVSTLASSSGDHS
jgi:cytochrome oxidase assembly protein ShyY1